MVKVSFLPADKEVEVTPGSTILQAAVAAGVQVQSACGAAGDGAIMALLSERERARVGELALQAEHIELSTQKNFQHEFIDSLSFNLNAAKTSLKL